jgi:hypothetical protein
LAFRLGRRFVVFFAMMLFLSRCQAEVARHVSLCFMAARSARETVAIAITGKVGGNTLPKFHKCSNLVVGQNVGHGVLSLLSGDGCLLDVTASVVSEDDRIGGVHRLPVACGERRRSVRVIVR